MSDESQEKQPVQTVEMTNRDLVSVLVLGALTGLFVWGVGLLLSRYAFDGFFCQGDTGRLCSRAAGISEGAGLAVGGILALFGLIRLRVYRPLLVVLASAISLWGIVQTAWGQAWYWGALIVAVMYLFAFGVYAWVARVRLFWIALAATVVLVALVRTVLAV